MEPGKIAEQPETMVKKATFMPTECPKSIDGNIWQWIHEIGIKAPIQPLANLGTGFVDFNPPSFMVEAHRKALDNVECNQYAPITGLLSLRSAVSKLWSPYYGKELDPETEICIHNGAQEGLLSCVMAFVQPGDEIILYVYQLRLAGATAKYVPLRPPKDAALRTMSGNDWTLDMDEFERAITPKTKAIILNNPHNPLGKVFTVAELRSIGNICISHDLLLISDEVYERIAYGSHFTRVASVDPAIAARTLTAISLGKLFNATGWRVGFVIGSADLVHYVQAMHVFLAYASSSPAQEACAEGLLEAERNGFWEENLRDVENKYVKPAGAYFLFVSIDRIEFPADYVFPEVVARRGSKDWKACFFLVNEIGLTSIPGTCFYGPENTHLGEAYIRLGVCKSDESLALAEQRLKKLKPLVK